MTSFVDREDHGDFCHKSQFAWLLQDDWHFPLCWLASSVGMLSSEVLLRHETMVWLPSCLRRAEGGEVRGSFIGFTVDANVPAQKWRNRLLSKLGFFGVIDFSLSFHAAQDQVFCFTRESWISTRQGQLCWCDRSRPVRATYSYPVCRRPTYSYLVCRRARPGENFSCGLLDFYGRLPAISVHVIYLSMCGCFS